MADDLIGDEKSLSIGRSGGIACCVPKSFDNSRRNVVGNYIFPTEPALGEKWMSISGEKNLLE